MIFLLAKKRTQNFEEKTQLLSHIFSFITIASKFGKNPHFHLKPHSLHYLRPSSFSFSGEKRSIGKRRRRDFYLYCCIFLPPFLYTWPPSKDSSLSFSGEFFRFVLRGIPSLFKVPFSNLACLIRQLFSWVCWFCQATNKSRGAEWIRDSLRR